MLFWSSYYKCDRASIRIHPWNEFSLSSQGLRFLEKKRFRLDLQFRTFAQNNEEIRKIPICKNVIVDMSKSFTQKACLWLKIDRIKASNQNRKSIAKKQKSAKKKVTLSRENITLHKEKVISKSPFCLLVYGVFNFKVSGKAAPFFEVPCSNFWITTTRTLNCYVLNVKMARGVTNRQIGSLYFNSFMDSN